MDRLAPIDFIKAVAIVAVVANHAVHVWAPPITFWDIAVRWMVQFHVASFFVASGYLYARSGFRTFADVHRRLTRVLVPYVVASAIIWLLGYSDAKSFRDFAVLLASGGVLPIYYFVFLMTIFILLALPLARLPRSAVALLLISLWVYKIILVVEPSLQPIRGWYWTMRDPRRTYDFFLAGWVAWAYREELTRIAVRMRAPLLVTCLIVIVSYNVAYSSDAAFYDRFDLVTRVLYVLVTCTTIFLLTRDVRVPTTIRFVSQATYGIYLYHFPLTMAVQPLLVDVGAIARITAALLVGLLGCAIGCWVVATYFPRISWWTVGFVADRD